MDYNQFSYYRANPYAKQGYMPPIAFVNRHKPNFLTELPMGEDHLGKFGRKQYANNSHVSHIDTDNLLKSPERYPYENRIALDKHYQRNLNTIDIEGASGGTLMSQAVRNKLKAREELQRRQQVEKFDTNKMEANKGVQTFEQERRRKIAYSQFIRDQQLKQQSENKLKPKLIEDSGQNKWEPNVEVDANPYYLNNRRQNDLDHVPLIKARHQSIEYSRTRENSNDKSYAPNNYRDLMDNLGTNRPRMMSQNLGSETPISMRQSDDRSSNERPRSKEAYNDFLAKDRKSLRYQNPTNLSSDGSIHYAARSIIQNQ